MAAKVTYRDIRPREFPAQPRRVSAVACMRWRRGGLEAYPVGTSPATQQRAAAPVLATPAVMACWTSVVTAARAGCPAAARAGSVQDRAADPLGMAERQAQGEARAAAAAVDPGRPRSSAASSAAVVGLLLQGGLRPPGRAGCAHRAGRR